MTLVARIVVHHLYAHGCRIVGGFVRDEVVRGDFPNDVDVHVPDEYTLEKAIWAFKEALHGESYGRWRNGIWIGLRAHSTSAKGPATCVRIRGEWNGNEEIEVDFTLQSTSQAVHPGIDASCSNVSIQPPSRRVRGANRPLGLTVKRSSEDAPHSLQATLSHIHDKCFVMYLPSDGRDARTTYLRRLTKYLSRGYMCVNGEGDSSKVPRSIVNLLMPKTLAARVANK